MEDAPTDTATGKPTRLSQMENIVAQYETPLLRYAGRILNNPVLAQDIVQNVFVKLFKAWQPGTRPSAQLKGWLYRVTHNEAVDHIRRETRLKDMHMEHAGENSAACADGLNCSMSDDDKMKLALRFIAKLPLRDQQVLLLRLQEGLPYKDIARITGRTTGNVGNILHHAVKRLSAELKQAGIGSVQPDQGANAT